jgi:hypothetical protein
VQVKGEYSPRPLTLASGTSESESEDILNGDVKGGACGVEVFSGVKRE